MTLGAAYTLQGFVGADWFQFADEPTHGREDGENFNFGLVDIQDRPYEELVEVFNQFSKVRSALHGGQASLGVRGVGGNSALAGVPPAPAAPFANFEANLGLQQWDRRRGFVPPSSELAVADLYICWSPQAIYLGLYGWDAIDEHFYASGHVPKVDRAVWTVATEMGSQNGGASMHGETPPPNSVRVTFGAGREALINDPRVRVESLSGTKLTVRLIAAMELPASRFGRDKFSAGDTAAFSSTFLTHARAYQIEWRVKLKLAN